MTQEYFRVALSSEISLAIPLDNMGKVVQLETQDICTIPGVADFWYGIVNLKGSLVWVLDSDRFFSLNLTRPNFKRQKLTAVVVKPSFQDNSRNCALVTPKLEGIIALESHQLEPIAQELHQVWHQSCDAVVQQATKSIYILNSANLLKQLHQKSTLVTAAN